MFQIAKKIFSLVFIMALVSPKVYATETVIDSISIVSDFDVNIVINENTIYLEDEPLLIGKQVYVPIRFLAEALGADEIAWEPSTQSVVIQLEALNITISNEEDKVLIDDFVWDMDDPLITYNNRVYVPIRMFSQLLGADDITWEDDTSTVNIEKEGIEIPEQLVMKPEEDQTEDQMKKAVSYTEDDLYWLSRIIHAEAHNEPYEGKLAVGNVVINRVNSHLFPSNIKAVIFDKEHGVQFTPTVSGSIYNTPNEECIRAAKEALEGNPNIGNALYFVPVNSTGSWVAKNRTYYKTIAGHAFYL
jgi:N-acetylmuramoyl-L-alanine amidase